MFSSRRPATFPKSSTRKTMEEEVGKDMNLDFLEDQLPNTSHDGAILQDFLAAHFQENPQTAKPQQDGGRRSANHSADSSAQTPATILSLRFGSPDFQYLNNGRLLLPVWSHPKLQNHGILASSSSLSKKMVPDVIPVQQSSADPRHKRMIKNRDSAARFRARKQAYRNELELELVALQKENAKLRRMNQTLSAAAPSQTAKKQSLYRTFSSPL